MDQDLVINAATMRHTVSRRTLLTSWVPLGGDRWAIVSTVAQRMGNETAVMVDRVFDGIPNARIAQWMTAAQQRVDNALQNSSGGAWEDAWHEGDLLSLISDVWARQLLKCRAGPEAVSRLIFAFEDSCRRVRARLAAASTELPSLALTIQRICRAPAVRAA